MSDVSSFVPRTRLEVDVVRLRPEVPGLARRTFALMGEVFAEDEWSALSEGYLLDLLGRPSFWGYAAVVGDEPVGGLTAHALPMTRAETTELLIYDLAVDPRHQRRGVGHALLHRLTADAASAGCSDVWVPADDDDTHSLEFYRRTGGKAQAVTVFTYEVGPD